MGQAGLASGKVMRMPVWFSKYPHYCLVSHGTYFVNYAFAKRSINQFSSYREGQRPLRHVPGDWSS